MADRGHSARAVFSHFRDFASLALFVTYEAGVMGAPFLLVALCTVIHLHTSGVFYLNLTGIIRLFQVIPPVFRQACDVPAPDIPTVLSETIVLVRSHMI